MNILLIDDDISILELLSIILENSFENTHIARATTPALGINELNSGKQYDLIICDYEMYPHGTGKEVFDYISEEQIQCQFLLFTSVDLEKVEFINTPLFSSNSNNYTLRKPCHPKEIRQKINEIIQVDSTKQNDYKSIKIHNFIRFNQTKCDVYIKINEDKYIKILNKNENFDSDFINKYISKNVKEFYILEISYEEFLVEFGSYNFLIDTTNTKDFISSAKKSHQYLSTLLSGTGLTDFIFDESSNLSLKSLDMVKSVSRFSSLIQNLIDSKDYSYDHTFLITSLCTHIGNEIGLSKLSIEKLALAALIHDLGISNSRLCYIHDVKPDRIETLEYDDQFMIKNHHNILNELNQLPDFTDDIQQIIKYHHIFDEKYYFGDKIQIERVSPIISVFLISHFFSNELYKCDFEIKNMRDILTLIKFKFNTANFKKIIKALEVLSFEKNVF